MSCVLIVYWSFYKPFEIAFNTDITIDKYAKVFNVIDSMTNVWFLIDILITFNTGFCEKGIIIMNRKQIAINYLKKWFVFDLLSTIPYNWILLN